MIKIYCFYRNENENEKNKLYKFKKSILKYKNGQNLSYNPRKKLVIINGIYIKNSFLK